MLITDMTILGMVFISESPLIVVVPSFLIVNFNGKGFFFHISLQQKWYFSKVIFSFFPLCIALLLKLQNGCPTFWVLKNNP